MNTFNITIKVPGKPPLTRTDIGTDSAALIMAAQDEFGPCSVTVTPA